LLYSPIRACRIHEKALGTESDRTDRAGMLGKCDLEVSLEVPKLDGLVVAAGRHGASVSVESQGGHSLGVRWKDSFLHTGARVPQPDGTIVATRGQRVTVGGKSNGRHGPLMAR